MVPNIAGCVVRFSPKTRRRIASNMRHLAVSLSLPFFLSDIPFYCGVCGTVNRLCMPRAFKKSLNSPIKDAIPLFDLTDLIFPPVRFRLIVRHFLALVSSFLIYKASYLLNRLHLSFQGKLLPPYVSVPVDVATFFEFRDQSCKFSSRRCGAQS